MNRFARSLAASATAMFFVTAAPLAEAQAASSPAAGADTSAPARAAAKATPAPPSASADAPASVNEGKVAYYGSKFAGRRTASGERFDPHSLTMAHRSLPFGSLVRVTNVKNKKSVVVRVNDRGPTTPDRIGDLSHAAAKRIGMTRAGVAEVKLDVVGKRVAKRGRDVKH
ncbi:MAG: septal ring lytic transglycosylase RlpA family protein [Burkholderiaceae bacterium]